MHVKERTQYPIELELSVDTRAALKEVEITAGDHSVGKQAFNLGLPEKVLITIIKRDDQFIVPRGTTRIRENDRLLILSDRKSTRLNSSHVASSYAVFCLKKKTNT